jgi:hypothetical protein
MKKLLLLLTLSGTVVYSADAQTPPVHKTVAHKHKVVHHRKTGKKPVTYTKHNIKVSENDARAPYEGKHSMENDGVKKNETRNLNYQNNSTTLPPVNGSNSR